MWLHSLYFGHKTVHWSDWITAVVRVSVLANESSHMPPTQAPHRMELCNLEAR